jgi:hypothetical protein
MKRKYFITSVITLIFSNAFACSYIPISFCETNNSRPNDIVICGKIFQIDSDGIDIEVIDVLKGVEHRDTIRVWDGTDFECTGLWSMAASNLGFLNDTVIVILPLIDSIENTWDMIGDYRSPDYFGYITTLNVTNNTVSGYINDIWNTSHIPYDDFKNNWLNSINECSNWLGINEEVQDQKSIVIYPNPSSDFIQIDNLKTEGNYKIYNIMGVLAFEGYIGKNDQINIQTLKKGLYFIQFKNRNGIKFIKE